MLNFFPFHLLPFDVLGMDFEATSHPSASQLLFIYFAASPHLQTQVYSFPFLEGTQLTAAYVSTKNLGLLKSSSLDLAAPKSHKGS
jgi:hypothetical protein